MENNCTEGHLSGIMPDVAMATASFGAMQLVEPQELELDLGDGASHLLQHAATPSGNVSRHHSHLQHQRQRQRHLFAVGPYLNQGGRNYYFNN